MNRTLPTPWKPTKAQFLAAHDKLVPDLVAKNLIVLFAGINPGLYTAAIGLQEAPFGGSHAWVLPNPSGLNAHYLPAALAQIFEELRVWAVAEHGRR
jgi:G:T/U-mismatch repair DNA glycosylase